MAFTPRTKLDPPKSAPQQPDQKPSGHDRVDRRLRTVQYTLVGAVISALLMGMAPSAASPESWTAGDQDFAAGYQTSLQAAGDFMASLAQPGENAQNDAVEAQSGQDDAVAKIKEVKSKWKKRKGEEPPVNADDKKAIEDEISVLDDLSKSMVANGDGALTPEDKLKYGVAVSDTTTTYSKLILDKAGPLEDKIDNAAGDASDSTDESTKQYNDVKDKWDKTKKEKKPKDSVVKKIGGEVDDLGKLLLAGVDAGGTEKTISDADKKKFGVTNTTTYATEIKLRADDLKKRIDKVKPGDDDKGDDGGEDGDDGDDSGSGDDDEGKGGGKKRKSDVSDPGKIVKSWTEPTLPEPGGWFNTDADQVGVQAWDSKLLPLFRWSNATTQIFSYSGGNLFNDSNKSMESTVSGYAFAFGNIFYTVATTLAKTAVNLDFLDTAGAQVDKAFAQLGKVLQDAMIIGVMCLVAIFIAVWRMWRNGGRGGGVFKLLIKPILLAAIITVLINGASETTEGKGKDPGKPGVGSPWFVAQTLSTTAETLVKPAQKSLNSQDITAFFPNKDDSWHKKVTSCRAQRVAMSSAYDHYSDELGKNGAIAESVSRMWESTGLVTWMQAQYGGLDTYEARVYCRMLDDQAGVPEGERYVAPLESKGATPADATPWKKYDRPQNHLMWAACNFDEESKDWRPIPTWGKALELKEGEDGKIDQKTLDDAIPCDKWYNGPKGYEALNDTKLAIDDGGKEKVAEQFQGDSGVQSFVLRYIGYDRDSAIVNALFYVVAAAAVGIPLSLLSVVLLGAKILLVLMIVWVLLALVIDILPIGAESKTKQAFMQFLGALVISTFAGLIFSALMLLTTVLVNIGTGLIGVGTFGATMWTGIAPAMAILSIHLMFTKWFKKPSPFTPMGAAAWGGGMATSSALERGINKFRRDGSQGGDGDQAIDVGGGAGADHGRQNGNTGHDGEDEMPARGEPVKVGAGESPASGANKPDGENTIDDVIQPKSVASTPKKEPVTEFGAALDGSYRAQHEAAEAKRQTKAQRDLDKSNAKRQRTLDGLDRHAGRANAVHGAKGAVWGAAASTIAGRQGVGDVLSDAATAFKGSDGFGEKFRVVKAGASALGGQAMHYGQQLTEAKGQLASAGGEYMSNMPLIGGRGSAGASVRNVTADTRTSIDDTESPVAMATNARNAHEMEAVGNAPTHWEEEATSEYAESTASIDRQQVAAEQGLLSDPYQGMPTTGEALEQGYEPVQPRQFEPSPRQQPQMDNGALISEHSDTAYQERSAPEPPQQPLRAEPVHDQSQVPVERPADGQRPAPQEPPAKPPNINQDRR